MKAEATKTHLEWAKLAHDTLAGFTREYNRTEKDLPLRWQVHPATWAAIMRSFTSYSPYVTGAYDVGPRLLGHPIEKTTAVKPGTLRIVLAFEL